MKNPPLEALVHWFEHSIELAATLIEVLAVAIIVIATLTATFTYVRKMINRTAGLAGYEQYKVRVGRALLLGLRFWLRPTSCSQWRSSPA